MADDGSLYHDEMKAHYRSDEVAEEYDTAFSDQGSVPHKASSASCFCGLSSVSKRLY
jgi:hypothetical protein